MDIKTVVPNQFICDFSSGCCLPVQQFIFDRPEQPIVDEPADNVDQQCRPATSEPADNVDQQCRPATSDRWHQNSSNVDNVSSTSSVTSPSFARLLEHHTSTCQSCAGYAWQRSEVFLNMVFRRGRFVDYARASALLLVAFAQFVDFSSDVGFVVVMKVRGEDAIFGVTLASLAFTAVLKLFLVVLFFFMELGRFEFCILLLLVLINADGFVFAQHVIADKWGGDWDLTSRFWQGDVGYLLMFRMFEMAFEALPQASIQGVIFLRDLHAGATVELWQLISLVASILVVAVTTRNQIINQLKSKSYFDAGVLWIFAASDTFLRVATIVLFFSSDFYLLMCTWWGVSAVLFLATATAISIIRSDWDSTVVSYFLLPAVILTPFVFIVPFDIFVVPIVLRQLEFLVAGCLAFFLLDHASMFRNISMAVMVVWPIATLTMVRSFVIQHGSFQEYENVWMAIISDSLKQTALGFDGLAFDRMCIHLCCVPGACCRRRRPTPAAIPPSQVPAPRDARDIRDPQWLAKAEELARRGFELGKLLDFYSELGTRNCMPTFDPDRSTTNDVVREAIIPASWPSRDASQDGQALALLLQGGPLLAKRLVSHTWTNLFANTVAAMVADALERSTYEEILPRLHRENLAELKGDLREKGTLSMSYWFCALSVNQHDNICAGFGPEPARDSPEYAIFDQKRRSTVTQEIYPLCNCPTIKHFNDAGALCEINKFDDMMTYMGRQQGRDFKLVVAVDPQFDLFSRIWCVAELVESRKLGIDIKLKLRNVDCMKDSAVFRRLRNLRVQDCRATRQADVDDVLRKIGDESAQHDFNMFLQGLLFDRETGIFKEFLKEFLKEVPDSTVAGEIIGAFGSFLRALV